MLACSYKKGHVNQISKILCIMKQDSGHGGGHAALVTSQMSMDTQPGVRNRKVSQAEHPVYVSSETVRNAFFFYFNRTFIENNCRKIQ